jgi:hypothetical protein
MYLLHLEDIWFASYSQPVKMGSGRLASARQGVQRWLADGARASCCRSTRVRVVGPARRPAGAATRTPTTVGIGNLGVTTGGS